MKLHIPYQQTRYKSSTISGGQDIQSILIEDADFANTAFNGLAIEGSKLIRVSFATSKLKHFNLTDVYAEDCLLFGADLDGGGWRRVEVKGGVLSGLALTDASLIEVAFRNCKLNLANFRFSKLKNVTFINCNLREADFYQASLTNVVFENCDLSSAHFGNARLDKVDLRSSNLANIKGALGLKGAKIDTSQLMSLASLLAVEIGLEVD